MIKIENTEVMGWEAAIRGMRNPKNSWGRSDSKYCDGYSTDIDCNNCPYDGKMFKCPDNTFVIGPNDHKLMMSLAKAGAVHAKYRRYIDVYVDVTAPLYFWKEFDTYRTVVAPNPFDIEMNSCSTMHKVMEKEFTLEDFSYDQLGTALTDNDRSPYIALHNIIDVLNSCRFMFLESTDKDEKKYWWYQVIQLLPSSYNQKRTLKLNYEVLANMYEYRNAHPLDEWSQMFCKWIEEELPYSEIITLKEE